MTNKYNVGDIVYDSVLKRHYMIQGLGWKKASTRAFQIYCFETSKYGMYSVYYMCSFDFIRKVA